jgi:two-component system, LytTR family, response regulator
MKAIAIDDEPIALEIISSHAAKVPFLQLEAVFTDAFKALEYLQHESIDVLFLDIKMPDISGIDFFNSLSKKPLLIFTTAYSEHAATSFDMDAVDYLLKPITLARFIKACNKANELYNYRNEEDVLDYIYVKTGYDQVKIMFNDILYVEAAGNYVSFVLKHEKILSRSTFAEATTILPLQQFVRVHRSFMVAVNKINKIEKGQVIIEGKEIPVSEGYLQALQEAIKKQQP